MISYAWAKATPIANPRTFHQWVRNQFGEALFSIFFRTYTEKVWGMSCDEISSDWAAQRIKGLSLLAAVIDGVKRSLGVKARPSAALGEQGGVKSLIESFRYPPQGPGNDVGGRRRQDQGAGRDHPDGTGLSRPCPSIRPQTSGP